MRICVLGLGYIGLPTAAMLAAKGETVFGVDVDPAVLASMAEQRAHFAEPGLSVLVTRAFETGNFEVGDRPEEADAFIIAVPTPLGEDKRADLQHVIQASEAIVPVLRVGNLVVIESTCPPRTTIDVVKPILDESDAESYLLAYSPERALPGDLLKEVVENDRVIGGVDAASAEAARQLYATFVTGDIFLTDATTAEMVKLLENASRDINIALANEFSGLAEMLGVNVWEAIELANRHPRIHILRPGPGVGGHCIAVDPWFLAERAPRRSPLIRQARDINDGQPAHVVEIIRSAVGSLEGTRLAVLGLAYKPDVDDLRSSPAVEVARLLVEAGAEVRTHEPNRLEASVAGASVEATLEGALSGAQAIVLLVDHTPFRALDPRRAAELMDGSVAVDLRGAWDAAAWTEAGFTMHVLGVGEPHA